MAIQESHGALISPGLLRHSPSGRTGVSRRPRARNDAAGSTQMQYPLAARSGEALGVRGGRRSFSNLRFFLY